MTRWDLVYKWADPETRSLVDAVTSALENCDRKLIEALAAPPDPLDDPEMVTLWDDYCKTQLDGITMMSFARYVAARMGPPPVVSSTGTNEKRRAAPERVGLRPPAVSGLDDWQQTLRAAMIEAINAETPQTGECGCGLPMDAHAGGMSLLHHDEHLIQVTAARLAQPARSGSAEASEGDE